MDHSTLIPDAVLTDVSHFIGNVLSGEKLSEVASQKRENVLKRLTVFVPIPATNQYLDMNAGGNKGTSPGLQISHFPAAVKNEYVGADHQDWEEEEYEECPAEMENFKIEQQAKIENQGKIEQQPIEIQTYILNTPNIIEESVKMQKAASELKSICPKSGPLLRKERKFFIDQFRRCWAAVYEGSIYFYASEGASKPTCVIDLGGYKARALPDLTKDAKKRDACFEIVCPGKKTFQLVARTAKDMHQWVVIVGKEAKGGSAPPKRRQLPSIPGDGEGDEYDDVDSLRAQHEDHTSPEEIYDDIKCHENSDDDSIYDDIGEIFPNRVFKGGQEDRGLDDKNSMNTEDKIAALLTNHDTAEEEDFYDDIDVFMNKDPSEKGLSSDNSLRESPSKMAEDISIINKKAEIELQTKEETAIDEDIYDDVGVLANKEQNVGADPPPQEENKKLTERIFNTPLKKLPDRTTSAPLKKSPGKEVPKNKFAHHIGSNNQTDRTVPKPLMLPKPTFRGTNAQGAGKPSSKNNIQNLIQQMESSLQMK